MSDVYLESIESAPTSLLSDWGKVNWGQVNWGQVKKVQQTRKPVMEPAEELEHLMLAAKISGIDAEVVLPPEA